MSSSKRGKPPKPNADKVNKAEKGRNNALDQAAQKPFQRSLDNQDHQLIISGEGEMDPRMMKPNLKIQHTLKKGPFQGEGRADFYISDQMDSDRNSMLMNSNEFMVNKKTSQFETLRSRNSDTLRRTAGKISESNKIAEPGQQLHDTYVYNEVFQNDQYPDTALDAHDYKKRLTFSQLQNLKREEMCGWKRKDIRGIKKNSYIKEILKKNEKILTVVDKNELEKLEVYTDRFPLLELRKQLNKIRILIVMVCQRIINSQPFNAATMSVIMFNSFVMMIQDPTNKDPGPFFDTCETVFTVLYSIEMIIKIMGLGLLFGQGAYLKDSWNILDFVIVMTSYSTLLAPTDPNEDTTNSGSFNLSSLRAFRVMRPLKTISSIKGLKVLMKALFQAIPLLQDTIGILLFFFLIFAIAGINLMQGKLKNHCVDVQIGSPLIVEGETMFCEGVECPAGYFCGKTNENPNFGVTNFDNVQYALLSVFQSVTLEGWSDIMKQMMKAFTYSIFIYFLPLVFIGAFFLLNLLLAVINSEFTSAHHDHQEQEALLLQMKKKEKIIVEEDEYETHDPESLTIMQFITGKIYARKMIEFLRRRQFEKKLQEQKRIKMKQKELQIAKAKRRVDFSDSPKSAKNKTRIKPLEIKTRFEEDRAMTPKNDPQTQDVIAEVVGEESDKQSDVEQLDKDIKEFLKKSRVDLLQQNHLGKNLMKTETFALREKEMPKMKGNIGPSSKLNFEKDNSYQQKQKQLFSKMAEDFDIDKIIPNHVQDAQTKDKDQLRYTKDSFNLSINNDEIKSYNGSDYELPKIPDRMIKNLSDVPGYINNNDQSSGLITSDSNFEIAAGEGHGEGKDIYKPKKKRDLKKDVRKTFKRILHQNNKRDRENGMFDVSQDSTRFGGSVKYDDFNSEIESKFLKKNQKKSLQKKFFKEDQDDLGFVQQDKDIIDPIFNKYITKPQEDPANVVITEYITSKRPKNPFQDLDPLTQKVDITPGVKYNSSSINDVFSVRNVQQKELEPLKENPYLMITPKDDVERDFINSKQGFIRPEFSPYQQKIWYEIQKEDDANDQVDSEEEEKEDKNLEEEQPFVTTASINYTELLRRVPTGEVAKRSDIMITSTMAIGMYPSDKRQIRTVDLTKIIGMAEFEDTGLEEYINHKNQFNALVKEISYQQAQIREKDKEFNDAYKKSSIHKTTEYTTKTMNQFKRKIQIINSNTKPVIIKRKDEYKAEQLKHKQNIRACQRRGNIIWNMEKAKILLEGKFHEIGEEDGEEEVVDNTKTVEVKTKEEKLKQNLIDNFEKQIRNIIREEDEKISKLKYQDEIPAELKKKYNLPEDMKRYQINFHEVKRTDFAVKKQKPLWSGQDVLQHRLDILKSNYIVKSLNQNRVWPIGLHGILKRLRFQLRIIVKSTLFDNFMTFAVLLNTIVLSMDYYGIEQELSATLDFLNQIFTWIFIVEMSSKLLAIGVSKYCAEKMNYLDGFVVLLSLAEMIASSIMDGAGLGLGAFKTIRMLRTFRVFRIARLLKALKSMQTILGVIVRSYKSFIYITMLMLLFVFIFSLLGVEMFGGKLIDPDGLPPRGNYDNFPMAFITVFQILTMENWNSLLYSSMDSAVNPYIVAVYYIVWIFIGNFILLNLFLAILLDSFIEEGDDDEQNEEMLLEMKKKQLKRKQKKKKVEANKLIIDLQHPKLLIHERNAKIEATPSHLYVGEIAEADEGEDLEDLDEDQVLKLFKEDGMLPKDQEELDKIKPYQDIYCAMSIYMLSKENKFRLFAYKVMKSPKFDKIIQGLIAISSIKLAADTYYEENPTAQYVSSIINYILNICFIIEMTIKIVAMGLIMDHGSYLRESWNQLDFFIVSTSIIDMSMTQYDIAFIKILRMLRVLRPLRMINHNVNLKMVVIALLDSMGSIVNVLVVIAVVFLIFAILGINFFGGKLFYCNINEYKIQNEQDCLQQLGEWKVRDFNYDNVKSAMLTLFVLSNGEAWPDFLIQAIDITGEKLGPTRENSLIYMIFFIIFIFIGTFFFLNFFLGVLFMKFQEAQKQETKGFTQQDLMWQDIQKMILLAEPEYESTNVPQQEARLVFHQLVTSRNFELFITMAIVLNMIQMSLQHEGESQQFMYFMEFTNYIFTFIFLIEAIFKLIAYGRSYFYNAWNKFDCFVVSSAVFDIILKQLEGSIESGGFVKAAPQIARVMRVLRVLRVVRLLSKAEGLQAIIETISFSIKPLSNVVILLFLIFFMFAVLGNFLFKAVLYGSVMDEIVNFQTFDRAFFMLFQVSTGENWPYVMMDCSQSPADGCIEGETCGVPPLSYFYFMAMAVICTYVMLNLFVLVILQQFEKYYLPKENMLAMFKTDLSNFLEVWKKYTQKKFNCKKIKESQLPKFFRDLGSKGDINTSLGFSEELYDESDLKKQILKMGIRSNKGCVYFNELLYRCMRRRYGNMKIKKNMQIIELRTQFRIYQLMLQEQTAEEQDLNIQYLKNNLVGKENITNPFLTVMNFKITFKTWLKFARYNIRKRLKEVGGLAEELFSSDEEYDINNRKFYEVQIEIEHEVEVTTDEDASDEERNSRSNMKGKSHISGSMGGSQIGSNRRKSEAKKPMDNSDHLKLFEDKLKQKMKEQFGYGVSIQKKQQQSPFALFQN